MAETSLDIRLIPRVYALVERLGKSVDFSVSTPPTFDINTNSVVVGEIGVTTNALTGGSSEFWDLDSVVEAELSYQFSSTTRATVLSGSNHIQVGEEKIGFTTVTDLGGGLYRLSELLRGLGGTEDKIFSHAEGESVSISSEETYTRKVTPPAQWETRFVNGTTILDSDFQIYLPAKDLPFTPKLDMTLQMDSATFTVVHGPNPIYTGESVALWEMGVRR